MSLAKTTFNTTVTIKQINIETQNKSKLIDLVNEFTAFRFLHEDNLVGYLDMFRHDGDLWVIQDDISETITLRQVLKTSSNEVERREPFMMKILPCILQGLDYLHRHGIIHGYLGVVDVIFTKTARVRLREVCLMLAQVIAHFFDRTMRDVSGPAYHAKAKSTASRNQRRGTLRA